MSQKDVTERQSVQEHSTFCHAISTSFERLKERTIGQISFNSKPAKSQRDIQGISLALLSKRKIS